MSENKPQNPKKTPRAAAGRASGGAAKASAAARKAEARRREEHHDEPAGDGAAEKPHSVGRTLRRAREDMKLSLEDVSAAINVRVVQLQAIEDERIDQLPGMTYAVGFVRSFADFVKLDANEIVRRFKQEHAGEDATKTELKIPDPIAEDKLPSPLMIGMAALAVAVVFILWSVFSDTEGERTEAAEIIPPAPVVGTSSGLPTVADRRPLTSTTVEAAHIAASLPAGNAAGTDAVLPGGGAPTQPAGAAVSAPAAAEAAAAPPAEVSAQAPAQVIVPPVAAEPQPLPRQPSSPVINVRRGTTRVMLEAREKSWVQVTDGGNKVIYKKVMSPGEQFFVPDQRGMSLVTSNAGGLDVYVDGKQVQRIGREGEILRGVSLSAEELKKRKIRVRD